MCEGRKVSEIIPQIPQVWILQNYTTHPNSWMKPELIFASLCLGHQQGSLENELETYLANLARLKKELAASQPSEPTERTKETLKIGELPTRTSVY